MQGGMCREGRVDTELLNTTQRKVMVLRTLNWLLLFVFGLDPMGNASY